MNPELERLILAYDACQDNPGDQRRATALDRLIESSPMADKEKLLSLLDYAHRRWLRAQRKPTDPR